MWHTIAPVTNHYTAKQQSIAMAWASKDFVSPLTLICELDLRSQVIKRLNNMLCSGGTSAYLVLFNYLKQIRPYGPDKQIPSFKVDLDL